MSQNNKKARDLSLILPSALLILEIVAVILLILTGYEITPYLFFFLILLGAFLIYQIGRQLFARWRINQAVTKIQEGEALADAGEPLKAIKLWKSLLLSLPEPHFFDVLDRMESTYEKERMEEAIPQVRAIKAESQTFFEMTRHLRKATPQDRRNWQAQAFELRKMIKALPDEPGQDLVDTKPET